MKLEELKHNHSLTDLLKIIIFSILMLLPFLSIGTRCLYVICNKNAHESYYGETINEKEIINITVNDLETGKTYSYISEPDIQSTQSFINNIYVSNFNVILNTLESSNASFEMSEIDNIVLWSEANTLRYEFRKTGATGYYTGGARAMNFTFEYVGNNLTSYVINLVNNNLYRIEYNKYSYLDNVFDYSVNQMTNSPTFNWTQNTALYTGVKGMTDNLQVQTNLIAVLIVYWTILTIIYIILDIVLKMFEWLTHGLVKKS